MCHPTFLSETFLVSIDWYNRVILSYKVLFLHFYIKMFAFFTSETDRKLKGIAFYYLNPLKLVAYSVSSYYLNQCWCIFNWTISNKHQWNFNQNCKFAWFFFVEKMHLKMSAKWQPFCLFFYVLKHLQMLLSLPLPWSASFNLLLISSPIKSI